MQPRAVTKSPALSGRGFLLSRAKRLAAALSVTLTFAGCHGPIADQLSSATPSLDAQPSTPIPSPSDPEHPTLTLQRTSLGVRVTSPWKDAKIIRGHSALQLHGREIDVASTTNGSALDRVVPDGMTLHYAARGPGGEIATATITTPPVRLPARIGRPRLLIDKATYTLSVLDGDTVVKTYAVGLGAEPRKRKICQDNRTTPEGLYIVYNLQPNATFHRAYDIDYPNDVDTLRHQIGVETRLVPAEVGTGGEIQIHGKGNYSNWTFGCIALNDEDIDELFEHDELAAGMEAFVCGSEVRPEDRPWLRNPPADKVRLVQDKLFQSGHYRGASDGQLGSGTQAALGRYQVAKKLPLTCQLDSVTRRHFGI